MKSKRVHEHIATLKNLGKEPYQICPSCGGDLITKQIIEKGVPRLMEYPWKGCANDKCMVNINVLTGERYLL